jgi:hemolysin III
MNIKTISNDEIANSITHGIGVLLGIVGAIYFIYIGLKLGSVKQLICLLIFVLSLMLVYLSSMFYHSSKYDSKTKFVFEKLDHSAIFLLIAGSYTPFMMFALDNNVGLVILSINWTLAFIGIILELCGLLESRKLALALYLSMGWLLIFVIKSLIFNTPVSAFIFLAVGAFFYTSGVYFYIKQKKLYFHAIWHIFVLLGSICHYISILILFINLHK